MYDAHPHKCPNRDLGGVDNLTFTKPITLLGDLGHLIALSSAICLPLSIVLFYPCDTVNGSIYRVVNCGW
jgi:hypothetical protein